MKEKVCYFCDICGLSYFEKTRAETCEKMHRMPVGVSRDMPQEYEHYPYFVKVTFDDGKEVDYEITTYGKENVRSRGNNDY